MLVLRNSLLTNNQIRNPKTRTAAIDGTRNVSLIPQELDVFRVAARRVCSLSQSGPIDCDLIPQGSQPSGAPERRGSTMLADNQKVRNGNAVRYLELFIRPGWG